MAQSKPQLFNVIEQQRFVSLETKRRTIIENLAAIKKENERSFADFSLPLVQKLNEGIFIKIEKLSSDNDYPESLALENVLSIYRNLPVRMMYYIISFPIPVTIHGNYRLI